MTGTAEGPYQIEAEIAERANYFTAELLKDLRAPQAMYVATVFPDDKAA